LFIVNFFIALGIKLRSFYPHSKSDNNRLHMKSTVYFLVRVVKPDGQVHCHLFTFQSIVNMISIILFKVIPVIIQ